MTWTSSYSGTGPCGIINTGGTLTSQGAKYAAAYSYDNLDRLTSGPADGGSGYTYDDSAHLDASGNIVCRAENGSSGSCAGTNPASWTGAQLGWDSAGRLVSWQNAPTNPSSTDAYAYDGEGQRVWQQSTTSGTATPSTTVYVGANLVDYTYGSGGSSTGHTNHYELPGGIGLLGVRGGSSTHLFLRDHLGTPVVQLDGTSGAVQNELLTQPYGRFRYGATTLYSYAFTGQRRDTTPDVMYFNARYYDQQSGAFLSADTVLAGGLNRYAYVGGNPESATDPSAHRPVKADDPPPEETGNPWIDIGLLVASFIAAYFIGSADTAQTAATISPGPVLEPPPPSMFPAASSGSSQWTMPDKDYIQGAEQTRWAVSSALSGAVQQLGSGTNPGTGPGTGPEPGPGTPPVTGPGGEPLGSSPNGEQGPEPQPSTEGAGSGVCCGCGCGGGSGGSGGVPPQGYGPAHSAVNAANLRQLAEYANKYGEPTFLDNGTVVFRGPLKPATNPGPSTGSRYVKAWNPDTGFTLGWYETILADGTPRVLHLKDIDGFQLPWGPHIVLKDGCLDAWW